MACDCVQCWSSTAADARNQVDQAALRTDADGVFWCDSDVTRRVDAIARFAAEGVSIRGYVVLREKS